MLTLRNVHLGETVWVIGSGASLSFVDARFFDDKVIVATNLAAHGLGLSARKTYVHSHYHQNVEEQKQLHPDWVYVTCFGDRGFAGKPKKRIDGIHYYHHYPTGEYESGKGWHPDGLIVGPSSIHGSMHLAAHMGAANIILCGADCGLLDGKSNYDNYLDEMGNRQSGDLITSDALLWLGRWEKYLRMVKRDLTEYYDVRIYSLNPFLNLNLEDHSFLSGIM